VSVFRDIERRIGGLVEGLFGRTFRSSVQPVELARKLAKEMDDHRTISIHRVYVPNEYTLYLSPQDRDQFSGYESQMRNELAEYLLEHARREGYTLTTRPLVLMETAEELSTGEFGIAVASSEGEAPEPERVVPPVADVPAPPDVPAGQGTMVYAPPAPEPAPAPPPPAAFATLRWAGGVHTLAGDMTSIGRSGDCDLTLDDPNISRRHAEVRRVGDAFTLVDLGSTNGTEVNGQRIRETSLVDGDVIGMGTTRLTFERGG
jgi:FhaA, N-terminal domain/FHA domain